MLRYVYVRGTDREGKPLNRGGYTIAFDFREQDDKLYVSYAFARCSEQDHFCRKIGRDIAGGRMRVGKCYKDALIYEKPVTLRGFNGRVIKDILGVLHA